MKQTIQLRLGQHLTMTPQLQQAIRLLQLSTLDLRQEIQQAVEANPMLELSEEEPQEELPEGAAELADAAEGALAGDSGAAGSTAKGDEEEPLARELGDPSATLEMGADPDELPVDSAWEDIYDNVVAPTFFGTAEDEGREFELHQIQNFDPVGVGARDLRECMLIQLQHYDASTPWLEQAKRLVSDHLELLAAHDFNQLTRRPQSPSWQSHRRPQDRIHHPRCHRAQGKGRLEGRIEPRGHSPAAYQSQLCQSGEARRQQLGQRLSAQSPAGGSLVHQEPAEPDFLEHGEEAMKPLVLHDVAEAVNMHESTISRVTTEKYMHTPRGIFELKYFFSSHVSTASGGECSATAIRALIKKLVAACRSGYQRGPAYYRQVSGIHGDSAIQ